MGDGSGDEAARGSYWKSIENRRKAGIAAAVAVVVLGVAGALALSATRPPAGEESAETTSTIIPAEETTETTVPVASHGETAAADAGAGTPSAPGAEAPPAGRGAVVAYRRDGWLCVANEDGTGERRIVASASGVHALSPDGSVLAYVDAASGTLALADAATGAVASVGSAIQDPPSWSSDSRWLAYTAPGPKVRRVTRFGTAGSEAFAGSMPSVSACDATLVGLAPSGEVAVWRAGSVSRAPVSGAVTGLATDGTTIYYGAVDAEGMSLRAVSMAGTGDRALVVRPDSARQVTFCGLLLTPSGSQLAYTECSDDGYSRLFTVGAAGGSPVSLSLRRDCYPLRWTADGAGILYIEGNALQGDPTALMRALASGASRRLLVNGASR